MHPSNKWLYILILFYISLEARIYQFALIILYC